jgi:D-hexose-6-phosphate mutarotase
LTFLGLEVAENKFEYFSEKRPKKITENLARKLVLKNKTNQRYEINPAFHAYLEINKVELMRV